MQAGKSMGDRYRAARLEAAQGNQRLGTYAGAAEAIGVDSPDTVGRWERDESTPTNFNVKQMALVYGAPELMANYCALSCPIGQGQMKEVNLRPIEQLTLRLHNMSCDLDGDIRDLMLIAEDGLIAEDERDPFNAIIQRLDDMAHTIKTLQIHAKKHFRKGGP